jgi:hypothetical protein
MEAAILAALAFHEQSQRAGQIVKTGGDDASKWKRYGGWRN